MDGPNQTGAPLRMGPLWLDPVPGAELEWWFGQGHVTGAQNRFSIMFALFRAKVDGIDGSVILTHLLDETTGRSHLQSRITPGILAIEDRIARQVARSCVSPWLPGLLSLALSRHRKDVSALVARHPALTVDPKGLRFGSDPFAASGGGLLLAHDPSRDLLRLTLPVGEGLGLEAHMPMPPVAMHEDAAGLAPGHTADYHYQCAPALPLTGRIGSDDVTGTLWFDRQWGTLDGWLVQDAARGKSLLGWDWFALSLGPDWHLMLNRHHDRPTGQTHAATTVLFDGDQPIALPQGHEATPLKVWRSPATGARYPVQWSIHVPDLALDLTLSPRIEDQELPLPGGLSVWEGAATFEGTLDGHIIEGRARMELAGYAAVLSIRDRLRRR
ncbi:MAG: lipocalin family protein [Pseudomonadota bacterium]|nr:lipocalin family protein [Pseudomonadota bacterium]